MGKFWTLVTIWIVISFSYIILAVTMPVIQQISGDTAVELEATSDMSNYPGTLEVVNTTPLFAWFIPGALGIAGSVYVLKSRDSDV